MANKKKKKKVRAKPAKSNVSPKPAKAKPAKAKPAKAKPAKAKPAKAKARAQAKPKVSKAKPTRAKTGADTPVTRKSANGSVAEGSRAPSFELPDQDGILVSSSSLSGKPYVLYFYPKDDTTGCTKEACDFRDFGGKFGAAGVRVIGVSPDSIASHAKFRSKYGLSFSLLADAEKKLAQAYGVWVEKQNYGRKYMGIERSTFLIDDKGTIKKAWRGVRVPGHVENVLAAL
jgi:peroxiredoxin Q/BCP